MKLTRALGQWDLMPDVGSKRNGQRATRITDWLAHMVKDPPVVNAAQHSSQGLDQSVDLWS